MTRAGGRSGAPRRPGDARPRATAARGGPQRTSAAALLRLEARAGAAAADDGERVVAATRRWLEAAVIGLNLCPFARGAYARGLVRFVVSAARTPDALLEDLQREMQALAAAPAAAVETTLLIHPHVLADFADYNDFLGVADAALAALKLGGTLQVASFHPQYRFAGTRAGDASNNTNRSPYPMLHLLREASVGSAVAAHPDPASIYRENIETMRRLGADGWSRISAAIRDV